MFTAQRLSRLFIGETESRREALRETMLASMAYGSFLLVDACEVHFGLMDARQTMWLTAFCVAGCLIFYVLKRAGISTRFRDPTMTLPQQLFGTIAVVWTYGINEPARGAAIAIMVLILLFGALRFRTRQMVQMSIIMLTMLAAVMLLRHAQDPADYPTGKVITQFVYTALVMWPSCVLTGWTGRLHKAAVAHKTALKQALAQIQRLAESDDLTGLINRRAMLPMMRAEMQARHPVKGELCLALIDIDRFKSVNDKYGHQAGDETLRLFANIGRATVRAGDMFARWGGEEFLLMLPDSSAAQGCECLERMRMALASANFDFVCPGYKLTISAGVTTLRDDDRLETALERADQAMYHAKRMGRDQVMVSGEPPVTCGDVTLPKRINAA